MSPEPSPRDAPASIAAGPAPALLREPAPDTRPAASETSSATERPPQDAPATDDPELHPLRVGFVLAGALAVVAIAIVVAFALLRSWRLDPGGDRDSAGLLQPIPTPRLQSAPQLDRAAGRTVTPQEAPELQRRLETPATPGPAPASTPAPAPASNGSSASESQASPTAPPPRPPTRRAANTPDFTQHLGARLAASTRFVDADGRPVALADPARVTVLLPAWYRCDTLCGTVAHGALEALADTGLPQRDWRLVLYSIDPSDTPADARPLRGAYAGYAAFARPAVYDTPADATTGAPPPLTLLTARDPQDIAALNTAIGYRAVPEAGGGYAHPAGLVVLTPEGTVSRYFFGVRFDPLELRHAIVDAGNGRIGTLAERLLLACAHLAPLASVRSGEVMRSVRVVLLLGLALLATWLWRRAARRNADPHAAAPMAPGRPRRAPDRSDSSGRLGPTARPHRTDGDARRDRPDRRPTHPAPIAETPP